MSSNVKCTIEKSANELKYIQYYKQASIFWNELFFY